MESFDLITYTHVYKENNYQEDSASKEGLLLDPGVWKVKERIGEATFKYYHHPFFDVVVAWTPIFLGGEGDNTSFDLWLGLFMMVLLSVLIYWDYVRQYFLYISDIICGHIG